MDQALPIRARRKAAATRNTIIEAAEQLMFEGGVDALSIEGVASLAEVAIQTVYNRVGGRPALIQAVAEKAVLEHHRYMNDSYQLDNEQTSLERLLGIAAAYTRFAREKTREFHLITTPPEQKGAQVRMVELTQVQNRRLGLVIQKGIEDGTFRPELDPFHTATALWAMMNGLLNFKWQVDLMDRRRCTPEQLTEQSYDILLKGILTDSACKKSQLPQHH